MEKWKKRAIDLMTSLAFGGKEDPMVVPYYPQKTRISLPEKKFFVRTTPEKQGISSKRIYNMLCELEGERRANIHTIMVLRRGEVISECSVDCYDRNNWHISNSMAKTVCGMVIGSLVDEGRLKTDGRLVDVFPEIEYRDKKFPLITIELLLTMTSGVDFAISKKEVTVPTYTATYTYTGSDITVDIDPSDLYTVSGDNQTVVNNYTWKHTADAFLKLIDEIQ